MRGREAGRRTIRKGIDSRVFIPCSKSDCKKKAHTEIYWFRAATFKIVGVNVGEKRGEHPMKGARKRKKKS